jgi:hypothetical protein
LLGTFGDHERLLTFSEEARKAGRPTVKLLYHSLEQTADVVRWKQIPTAFTES